MNTAFNKTSKKSKKKTNRKAKDDDAGFYSTFCDQCGSGNHDMLDCELFFENMTGFK
jgi:hypothetical protein